MLLVQFGLLDSKRMDSALQTVTQTGLPLERVLVLGRYLKEEVLDTALQCLLCINRHEIDRTLAKRLLRGIQNGDHKIASETFARIEEKKKESKVAHNDKLGGILLEAGLISQEQLESALQRSLESAVQLGRCLVLAGIISESILTAALNAQSLLRANRVDRVQAIKSLKTSFGRLTNGASDFAERDFYWLPECRNLLLGELLLGAGVLSATQLNMAIETSFSREQFLGQTLVSMNFVTQAVLEQALQLQKLIVDGIVSREVALGALSLLIRERLSIDEAIKKVSDTVDSVDKNISFDRFLLDLGLLNEDVLQLAFNRARKNVQTMLHVLLFADVIEANLLHQAAICGTMIEAGRISSEHAHIAFEYARKRQIDIQQALQELNWSQSDYPRQISNVITESEWELRNHRAEKLLQNGEYEEAELQVVNLISIAEKYGRNTPRFVNLIETLGHIYCKLGDLERAEQRYNEALQIKLTVLPENSLHIAATINNLAKVCYFLGRFEDAEKFAVRYLRLYRENLPPEHPDLACALQNLATLYHSQKKYTQAEPFYYEALTICRSQLGDAHPATIRLSQNYAELLKSLHGARMNSKRSRGRLTGSWKSLAVPENTDAAH